MEVLGCVWPVCGLELGLESHRSEPACGGLDAPILVLNGSSLYLELDLDAAVQV